MGAYEYTVLDGKGREQKGVIEGDTPRQIRQQLRDKGFTPLAVNPVEKIVGKQKRQIFATGGVSALDLALLTRQLSALLGAGLPLEEVLGSVAKQSSKPRVQKILLAVRSKVREGHSLAAGLADFPGVFPEIYRKTIQAGEATGHLNTILERLAEYTENRHQIRQTISNALFYPILLTIIAFGIVIAMLTYVVPSVVQIFSSVSEQVPLPTQILINISNFMRDNWKILFFGGVGLLIFLILFFRRPAPKYVLHSLLLRMPLFGKMIRTSNAAQFGRTLSILTGSNVPIVDALNISSQVLTNRPMRSAAERAAAKVREGSAIHTALGQSPFFPPITISLIASGEASGNLDSMLSKAAEIQEREIQSMTKSLLSLFEPLLILIMGAIILVIVLALLLPIFELNMLVR